MKKIDLNCFHSNRDMLDKDVLRYVENFYQYLFHISNFFGEKLNVSELRVVHFLIQRIELFLKDAPVSDFTHQFVGRYKRVLSKLKKIENEQAS